MALVTAPAAALLLLAPAARGEDSLPPRKGTLITDPALSEISGIVPASGRDGVFWVHNDSGDRPRIFALEDSGRVLGAVDVEGASAVDWEDIAAGPGPRPGRHLFLADTGNNDGS
ncbi:MAG TPA: hypothetical protein VMT52_19360, partial [Planctomycetota bacterium]|nr:hypothetical protein [Planctomycetota bacterium]